MKNLLRGRPSSSGEVKAITFFRVLQGDIIIEDSSFAKYIYGGSMYTGKDCLFSSGYSYIIPKASPLKASLRLKTCLYSLLGKIYFAEGTVHGHRLVSGHGGPCKDDGGCDLHILVIDVKTLEKE